MKEFSQGMKEVTHQVLDIPISGTEINFADMEQFFVLFHKI